jgi:hypothetical protein
MRNDSSIGCGLIARMMMIATRNAAAGDPRRADAQRLSKAGSPPCAVMLTESARSVA